tara:strand:- start:1051 stop:2472 length:1422 start_codon:yes stop_codon:yes gene_type:complete
MKKIDYVSSTALTPINLEPYTEHGGGGFKKLVAVAAVIAIPIAAPAIASSIGLSAAVGSVMGSALVGAGLGAATGAITGQDIGRSALMGGLSGGVAGYFNPGTSTVDGTTFQNQTFSGSEFRPDAGYNTALGDAQYANMENIVMQDANMTNIDQPQTLTDGGANAGSVGDRLSNTGANTRVDGMGANIQNNAGVGNEVVMNTGAGVNNTAVNAGAGVNNTAVNAGNVRPGSYEAAYGQTQFTGNTLADTGNVLKARFTDPRALADVSIQAGLQLIGAEIMGVGDMSDEEKELLRLQKEQMEELKQRDREAYDFAMKRANELYAMGQRFDPEQMARQYYGRASQKAGIAKRDALRNINPSNTALRAAEERRFNLGTAANTGSAYDRGMIAGLNQQANYLNKASSAFPNQGGNYSAALTGLNQTYANLAQKKSAAQQGLNQMFGAFGVDGGDGNDAYRAGLRDGLFGGKSTFRFS